MWFNGIQFVNNNMNDLRVQQDSKENIFLTVGQGVHIMSNNIREGVEANRKIIRPCNFEIRI